MEGNDATAVHADYPTLLGRTLSPREARLLERARTHAADFATRAAEHDRDNTYPLENFEAMKESGYAFMTLPARYGGEDVNLLELCACQEQLAQGCGGTAIAVNMHIFTLGAMQFDIEARPDRAAQTEMVLAMVGGQRMIMCGSFSETGQPGAYVLPATKARRVDGGWVVNGRKSYNSNYPAAEMVGFLVHLEDHPDGDNIVAMTFTPRATPGLSSPGAGSWDVLGVRASGSYDVVLENVFIPDLLMPPGQPASGTFSQMAAFGAWFNITVSAVYLGIAQAAVDWITDYIKTRKPPTEERPLSHMAGMQYQLAEMLILQEASRAMIKRSAEDWMVKPWDADEASGKGSICKYLVTNNSVKAVSLAMDMAGGPGLFRRFGLERLYRDVRAGKAHPPSDMMALEWIAKRHLGIARDFTPRWG